MKQKKELEKCTFKPRLNRAKSSNKRDPARSIGQFLKDQKKFDEEKQIHLREKEQEVMGCLKPPRIDKVSRRIVEKKQRTEAQYRQDVHSRLFEEQEQRMKAELRKVVDKTPEVKNPKKVGGIPERPKTSIGAAPSSFVNDNSYKYILKKFDREIKEAHNCESLQAHISFEEVEKILGTLGYLSYQQTKAAITQNEEQMREVWRLLEGAGSHDVSTMKMVNLKRFFCALEGIATSRIMRKDIEHDAESMRDEANNFFVDDKGVKDIFKTFRPIIQNKVQNSLIRRNQPPPPPAKKKTIVKRSKNEQQRHSEKMLLASKQKEEWRVEEMKIKQKKEKESCSFKPQINKNDLMKSSLLGGAFNYEDDIQVYQSNDKPPEKKEPRVDKFEELYKQHQRKMER